MISMEEKPKQKEKSNNISVPSLSLPKGGGAIKGIDEKFSVNAVNGSASFSIPLPFSPARGASPSLYLSYNSGAGNGIFGLGWNLGLASIKRKTDKGLPQYLDDIESDIFLLSDAEDLVPEFKKESDGSFSIDQHGDYIIHEKDSPDGLYKIRFYKPRIEGLFSKIERWTAKSGIESGKIKWRVITKDNVTTLFGWTENAMIFDPLNDSRIYEWLPEFVFDDKGNCSHYIYKIEDDKKFDPSLSHNRNRRINGKITYTNIYLEKVLYGNITPYKNFGDPFPDELDYLFSTIFDYGEYDQNPPYQSINDWAFRTDAFSDYKAGFEIRTTRLCKRVLLFHHFKGSNEYEGLVKSLNFEYDSTTQQDFTFLKSITTFGYIKQTIGTYTNKNLPPLEFEYQKHDWNKDVKTISTEDLVHAPSGLDEQQYQFTDLFNEGLSGILTEQANGWYYKHNLGDGKFEQAKLVTPKPSFAGLGRQLQLADLDADGGKQLVSYGIEPKGYFELDDDNEWQPYTNFQTLPNINLNDANTRMLDLNGDGKPDVLISEDNVFTWYESAGRNGFTSIHKTTKPFDEEAGPHIVFADPEQTIFLADMSGDGLSDIVRIRNGEVCYWPNLGYGKFGAKVAMDNPPLFDHPDSFNPAFLRLADIDGSGTTDIIYLRKNKFTCWMNLSGNSFSVAPFEIDAFPEVHNHAKITVTDLLGNGVVCIVWSCSLSKDTFSPLRYIDLMNSKKPHIMISYKNNMGKEVSLEYTPSTKFYIEDKMAGKPWITKLHFPIHCISKTETLDNITGWRFVSSYKYHHGYYDHPEREFRGFGMVEQTDAESFENWAKGNATNIIDQELHQEPVVSKTWFHTGAFLSRENILNQFAHEYWYEEMNRQGFPVLQYESPLPDARIIPAPGIPDTIVDNLSADEWREALRACKSMALRSEIFAHDAPATGATADDLKKQLTPFSVVTHNCIIELAQPKGQNKYAVFTVKESEAITYSYERDSEDPRIAHNLNINLDEYGNVLESASVVYPRIKKDATLPIETQNAQNKLLITYTQNKFTDDAIGDDVNRLRLPAETKTFELKDVPKTGSYYSLEDFKNILDDSKSIEKLYQEINSPSTPGKAQRRLIEHVRTIYYNDDLTAALPLLQLNSKAIPFENYQLAYIPQLLADIYSAKADDGTLINLMEEGKFTHAIDENGKEDVNWWIPSGTIQYLEGAETLIDAQQRFYVPISYTEPFGAKTKVKYYGNYFFLIEETEDAVGNVTTVEVFNFRTLSPQRIKDANDNLSETINDELGLVKAMAIFGKGNEADDLAGLHDYTDVAETNLVDQFFNVQDTPDGVADSITLAEKGKQLLQHATARFVYDFDVYKNSSRPVVVASIVRDEHFQKNNNSPVQLSFEYSNGLGQIVMKKVQAEPGLAKKATVDLNDTYIIQDIDTSTINPPQLRWIGNGRTILNNKGNPVKQYEPYFSTTYKFEDVKELVETGVTPVLYYDAMSRLVKTEFPDRTFSKIEFDSWMQIIYDRNDTVLESSWYNNRFNRLIDAELIAAGKDPVKEKEAAEGASKHANTPSIKHFDTLGRLVLLIENNGKDALNNDILFYTKNELDIEGNIRSITDTRGNTVMQHKFDMLGNKVYQLSMDAGQRWLLINILGNPLRTWDERNHEFSFEYDILHRPTAKKVIGGDGSTLLDNTFEKIIYGEGLLNDKVNNFRTKVVKIYDTAGKVETAQFDFKGNPISTSKTFAQKYKEVVDWSGANPDANLDGEVFTSAFEYDALYRITQQTFPDSSIFLPQYNEAGLLNTVQVTQNGNTEWFVKNIDYNEKAQRKTITYGNNVSTNYFYDEDTFRLIHLQTKRQNNDPLQDLYYTFDPVGNITHIEDKNIPAIFFNNQKITGTSYYTYDALYRLTDATGREHAGQLNFGMEDNWNDLPFLKQYSQNDPMAWRTYTQQYLYDGVGNILQMQHTATNDNWTRNYNYAANNNRLSSTTVGADTYNYPHHPQHGFITSLPHLQVMNWNFKDELQAVAKQAVVNGTPETTYYVYDNSGQRARKITERQAGAGVLNPSKKSERIYLGAVEIYREYDNTDTQTLERQTCHVMDDKTRIAMIETRTQGSDDAPSRLVQYQHGNHLGSASIETDDSLNARIISYEEYHPYGTTSYQAVDKDIKAAYKRYRYTGMERDEESGFSYHNARYYILWLGRWLNPDPAGIKAELNLYAYCRANPLTYTDTTGADPRSEIGEIGELATDQFLDREGFYVFRDWSKKVNEGGFDSIAYNPKTKEIFWIDNKAYEGRIKGASSLEKNFAQNRKAAIEFLHTQTGPEAEAALAAVENNEVKLISNAMSGPESRAAAGIFKRGIRFLDVYKRKMFSSLTEYAAHTVEKDIQALAMSRGMRIRKSGGFATLEGIGLVAAIAIGTTVILLSEDKLKAAKDMAVSAVVDTSLIAIFMKVAGVGGGMATIMTMVIGMESDNPDLNEQRAKERMINNYMYEAFPELFTKYRYCSKLWHSLCTGWQYEVTNPEAYEKIYNELEYAINHPYQLEKKEE